MSTEAFSYSLLSLAGTLAAAILCSILYDIGKHGLKKVLPKLPRALRWLAVPVAVAGLAILLLIQQREQKKEHEEQNSRRVAAEAVRLHDAGDESRAQQFSLAAYFMAPTDEAAATLMASFGPHTVFDQVAHTGWAIDAAFSPDGRTLATAGKDGVRLWEVTNTSDPLSISLLDLLQPDGNPRSATAVAFSPDGRTLAVATISAVDETDTNISTVQMWDVTSTAEPAFIAPLTGWTGVARDVVYSPDGKTLALTSGGTDNIAKLWDVSRPAQSQFLTDLRGHDGQLRSVAFSPDSGTVATTSDDGTARLWDVRKATESPMIAVLSDHGGTVRGVSFSPDGKLIATTSRAGTFRLWNIADPAKPEVLANMQDNPGPFNDVSFSPDGDIVFTVGRTAEGGQGMLRMWSLADQTRPRYLVTELEFGETINGIAYSRDGRTIATVHADGHLRLTEVAPENIAERACENPLNRIGRADWETVFPDIDYADPCT